MCILQTANGGDKDMKITVIGTGAIGGVLAAHMVQAGHDVEVCDIAEDHVAAMNAHGLRIEGPQQTFTVPVPAYTPEALVARGDLLETVLLCVKSQHTEHAVRQVLPIVGADTYVVSCQNGLCENIIADVIGRERTVGCFVNFSADYLEPGRILYGGLSALYLGELDNTVSDRVLALQRLLSCWGPVQVTDNIWGYLWGKLSYAALLFATALVDETMAGVVRHMDYRAALLEMCSEVLETAAKQGIHPMGFDDWAPSMVYPREAREEGLQNQQLAQLAERMASNKKTKSGVWRDLAVRKRKTEVDYQLTPVVRIGESLGVDMRLTRYVVDTIHAIEAQSKQMSWGNLDGLNEVYQKKCISQRVGRT